jgi:hypothetical protein
MKRSLGPVLLVASLLATACGGPAVVADSRGPFDTVSGVYGGNEFSPLSAEGKRTFAGDTPDKVAAPAPAPATAPMAGASAAPAIAPIPIDPNAFGAIFPTGTSAVKPTGEQLMQLDNLALIAAEPLRTDLQRKILACRRAGDACRLGPR